MKSRFIISFLTLTSIISCSTIEKKDDVVLLVPEHIESAVISQRSASPVDKGSINIEAGLSNESFNLKVENPFNTKAHINTFEIWDCNKKYSIDLNIPPNSVLEIPITHISNLKSCLEIDFNPNKVILSAVTNSTARSFLTYSSTKVGITSHKISRQFALTKSN